MSPARKTRSRSKPDDNNKFCSLAFKLWTDPYAGKLVFFRVYSGHLKKGDTIYNPRTRKRERVSRLMIIQGSERKDIDQVYAGDIAALVGLRNITTGDTLCDEDFDVTLEPPTFPEPVISMAVEPKTKQDRDKMSEGLQRLAEEDPTFRCFTNEETSQLIIAGMGELHLEIIIDRLKREFKVDANTGAPQIAYRETITEEGRRRRQIHPPIRRSRPIRPCLRQGRSRTKKARASRSSTRSSAARFPRNTFRRSLTASKKPSRAAFMPATRSLTSRCEVVDGIVPRSGLERTGVQDGGHFRAERRLQKGRSDSARTDHEGGSAPRPTNIRAICSATSTAVAG